MIRSPKNIHQDGKIHRVLHGRTDQTVALIRAQDASQRVATHFGTRKEFLAEWSVMAAMMRELWPWLSVCGSMKGSQPIGSMYAIYGNIYHQYTPNVSIYTSTMDPSWVVGYDPTINHRIWGIKKNRRFHQRRLFRERRSDRRQSKRPIHQQYEKKKLENWKFCPQFWV